MRVSAESKALVSRLEGHFSKEGYRFSLIYESTEESSEKLNVSNLIAGPTVLICDGTVSEVGALLVDQEIERYLGAEALTKLERLYKLKESGYCISGSLLRSRKNHQAEQAGAGQPATRPESKSEGGDKPQPEAEGRSR